MNYTAPQVREIAALMEKQHGSVVIPDMLRAFAELIDDLTLRPIQELPGKGACLAYWPQYGAWLDTWHAGGKYACEFDTITKTAKSAPKWMLRLWLIAPDDRDAIYEEYKAAVPERITFPPFTPVSGIPHQQPKESRTGPQLVVNNG
jgi:hypothetical protein